MSTRLFAVRAVPVALGLSLMLIADAFALPSPHRVEAASDAEAGVSVPADSADALACPTGFGDIRDRSDMSLHGVAVTDSWALAVGFTRRRSEHGGQRRPASLYASEGRWSRAYVPSPGAEDGLVAVAANGERAAWAVGFMTTNGAVRPLAMRWNGRDWTVNRPPARGELATMLTDVTVVGNGDPFAVGYRMTPSGKRKPVAVRRVGDRWQYLDPRAGKRESISLTGISSDGDRGLWAVGHGGSGTFASPVIYRRLDRRWARLRTPALKGEAVLTDVVATARNDAWAVGYQQVKGRSNPLVLHWNGKRWRRTEAPGFTTHDTVLTAVSAPEAGGVWVVGSGWNPQLGAREALAAWWDGHAWNSITGPEGGDELQDVAGSLHDGGWAVGRAGKDARATRVCVRPQASIFGGSEPLDAEDPSEPLTASFSLNDDDAISVSTEGFDDDDDAVPATAGVTTTELIAGKKSKRATKARKAKQASRARQRARTRASRLRRERAALTLPRPRADARVNARNVAARAGVAANINTYGAVTADFDADGDPDLYIGGHGHPGRLLLNDGGTFSDHEPMVFPEVDRHGCTAADIDGSGLPDLYCAVGGRRGSGLKANELWIDPGGPQPRDVAVAAGVADPTGRGRESAFLSAGRKGPIDLVVTNSPTRVDGLPSIGRLYRSNGEGLSARARVGFAPRLGALSVQDADFDRDGREDLLLVTGGPQAPKAEGTRLYRNTRKGLVDITRRSGITSFGEVDAALVDIDRRGMLDLVQLSPTRIRVSVWRKGRFVKVWEKILTHGRAIAAGDVNGDKRDDLYLLRGNGSQNPPDVMLINRKSGRNFTSVAIPQASSGDGDAAVAIDHDGNGLTDFLVLNGRSERGPTQLVAFYRRK